MKIFVVFLSVVFSVNATSIIQDPGPDACAVPPSEAVVKNSIPKANPQFRRRYPRGRINKLIRSNGIQKNITEAISTLKFCDESFYHKNEVGRAEKTNIPHLPPSLTAEDTCSVVDRQISIPSTVSIKGLSCWVLKPWAKRPCSYVSCSSENCLGVPKSDARPTPDQFKCRPVNPRRVKVYALCFQPSSRHRYRFRYTLESFTIRLPQCCSCIRFSCARKG